MDLKEIVQDTQTYIVKTALNRILYFDADSIINALIELHIEEPANLQEVFLTSDKFFIAHGLWKATLETLYAKYMPEVKYEFDWKMEVTPYTMMYCELTKDYAPEEEWVRIKKITGYTDEKIETEYDKFIKDLGFDAMGFPKGLYDFLPEKLIPATKVEQLKLLFRLMNFPPLRELAIFQNYFHARIKKQIESLSVAFSGIDVSKLQSFGMEEPLHYSYFQVPHSIFKKYGIGGFEGNPNLSDFKDDWKKIRERAIANADKFTDQIICPCCGKKQVIKLPEEVLEYKFILENNELARQIGLLYLDEYILNYKHSLSERFYSFIPNLNLVENPDCIILVEGESEEISIPILGFRKRFILSQRKIQVYNSKSKQKLKEDFFNLKSKYPSLKIVCILDDDAVSEKNDIQRVVEGHKDQYNLVFISDGTFEDLFDLPSSIIILNELYPEGEAIVLEDFDTTKSFLKNIKPILFKKKKASFDKVAFARLISYKIDIEKLPKEIEEIFELVQSMTEPTTFVKAKSRN